jgi:hypothetical protein
MSNRASVPTALVRFWINDRNATTDPTPNAMHRKKNSNRRHEERISRLVRLNMNFIAVGRKKAQKTQNRGFRSAHFALFRG